jgi:hypothetical protein
LCGDFDAEAELQSVGGNGMSGKQEAECDWTVLERLWRHRNWKGFGQVELARRQRPHCPDSVLLTCTSSIMCAGVKQARHLA